MIVAAEFEHIKKKVFDLIGFCFSGEISTQYFDGVKVDFDGENAVIGCKDKTTLARGLFLLSFNAGKETFSIEQKAHFETLGVMIECSRNAVMRPQYVKKYIEYMAALGFNALMLYTEDTFEMEKYPRFGYMRGRYTLSELQEIDDYADSLGIEVIPCIQTLGHMSQYLKYKEAAPIKDTDWCMLVGAEETYEFIEEVFKTCRKAFRSNRIQLNIDETWDLGLGNYLRKNGYKDKIDIILEHIPRVYELCKKYDYNPMMASDMFFRLATGGYYTKDAKLPKEYQKYVPEDMTLVYWDYYHYDKELYENLIDCHRDFGRPVSFYGSIWNWEGFVENTICTYETSVPAMEACIEKDMKDVYITLWGDDGQEGSNFRTISSLPLFSEMCYTGEAPSMETLDKMAEALTGVSYSDKLEISKIHAGFHQDKRFSARILYADIFYNTVNQDYEYEKVMKDFSDAWEYTKTKNNDYFKYCHLFADAVMKKCEILNTFRKAYEEGNREYLTVLKNEKIPKAIKAYEDFMDMFADEWNKYNKTFGLEVIINRIGGVIYRMKYAVDVLERYLKGEIEKIEELDEKMLPNENPYTQIYIKTVTPSSIV